jgi:hypothetical protein
MELGSIELVVGYLEPTVIKAGAELYVTVAELYGTGAGLYGTGGELRNQYWDILELVTGCIELHVVLGYMELVVGYSIWNRWWVI